MDELQGPNSSWKGGDLCATTAKSCATGIPVGLYPLQTSEEFDPST